MTLCTRNKILATIGLCVLVLAMATIPALAQAIPNSTQFDMTGYLQAATVDTPGDAHSGGSLTVNNHKVTVPKETVVILPANALTWEELFALNPSKINNETGLALSDTTKTTHPAFEVEVVGNRVGDQYIAGLVYLSQQGLNSGQGFINFIDYANAVLYVGGAMGTQSGARVMLNDPATVPCAAADAACISTGHLNTTNGITYTGRFSKGGSPDPRFTVDQDNPTITAATAFPMCLAREDPSTVNSDGTTGDSLCPEGNRPAGALSINTVDPNVNPPGTFPDASKQAPFEVGDYITYAGTLFSDSNGDYISAHTITNNTAIYTAPGTFPAYVATEVALIGTGGLTVLGAGEAAIRTRFEGMSSDPSRNVHLYGMDLDTAGNEKDRDWGMIGVDPGPPTGALKGRWRFRPPCTAPIGSPTQKACSPPPAGTFLPPTREVRAVVQGAWVPGQTTKVANGLIAGQYHAPILQYIFPENVPGSPIVANNFEAIDFLANGGYSSSTGVVVGQLNPWPGSSAPQPPPPACTPPTANAGGPYAIANGGTVTLSGTATGTAPLTFAWSVAPTTAGTITNGSTLNPTFTGSGAGGTSTLTLAVTGCGTTVSATASVTENAPTVTIPVVNPTASPSPALSGQQITLNANAVGSGISGYLWTQTSGSPSVLTAASQVTATPKFTVTIPVGTVTSTTLSFSVTATNSAGTSAPGTVSVTIKPQPDSIAITTAQYRTSKQRIDLTVTDNVVSPNVVLKLQPYLTESGTIFDPSVLGNTLTNTGAGAYTLTLVGAPPPACNLGGTYATPCSQKPMVVKSNIGGASPTTALTNIRQ